MKVERRAKTTKTFEVAMTSKYAAGVVEGLVVPGSVVVMLQASAMNCFIRLGQSPRTGIACPIAEADRQPRSRTVHEDAQLLTHLHCVRLIANC